MSLFTRTLDIGQDGCGTVIPCIVDVVGSIKSWWETTDSEGRFIIVNFCFVLQRCISDSVACVAQPGRGGGVACVAYVA